MIEKPLASGRWRPMRLLSARPRWQLWLAESESDVSVLKIARGEEGRSHIHALVELLDRCSHPHIVAKMEHDLQEGWVALEHVRGATLDRWSRGKSITDVIRVAIELTGALTHLHNLGVVHGDLAPKNIIVSPDGHPKLIDLGNDAATQHLGTPGFIPPEVLAGNERTAASDVYGLGALIFAALTGRPPFAGPEPATLKWLPLHCAPPTAAEFRPQVSEDLDDVLMSMLARDPTRRPPLDTLADTLFELDETEPPIPVVGMHDERERLRRCVADAADGETIVAVVYGPPGSGRSTLVQTTTRSALSEGLTYLNEVTPQTLASQAANATSPVVLVLPTEEDPAVAVRELATVGASGLILTTRLMPMAQQSGTVQITPSGLELRDARDLARAYGLDPKRARRWWSLSDGLPRTLHRIIHKKATGKLRISPNELAIIKLLQQQGPLSIHALGDRIGSSPHHALDECSSLLAQGILIYDEQQQHYSVSEKLTGGVSPNP